MSVRSGKVIVFVFVGLLAAVLHVPAQEVPPSGSPGTTARAAAPIDVTGYWVSIITEDWLWRMRTPAKGDYTGVPLNDEGRRIADAWDPSRDQAGDNACKAYGAPALMRNPTRLHITWENDNTLRIDTDAGQQTRLLHFDQMQAPNGSRSRQGFSAAAWDLLNFRPPSSPGGLTERGGPVRGGSLKVVTTHLQPGYLRWNGVPYSENAILTEYFDRHSDYGTEWLFLTAIVDDPQYLTQRFIVSSHFKREPDASKWNPRPCEIVPPRNTN